MSLEPIVVNRKYDSWIARHGTASTAIERFDTKDEAVNWAKTQMKQNAHPALIVHDSDYNVQYVTMNPDVLKSASYWKQVGLFSN